jgi:hypothetical protein
MSELKINNPGTAAVLSFVFSGLGQLYNGQIIKGLVVIFLTACSLLIFMVGAIFIGMFFLNRIIMPAQFIWGGALLFVGLVAICIMGIYSIVDAYRVAKKKC